MKTLLCVLLFFCCASTKADPDIDRLAELAENSNKKIIPYPIIIAKPYDTLVELEQQISGSTLEKNTFTRSVKTSRSLETNNTADNSWEQTIKRSAAADVGANIGSGGKGFSLSGKESYIDGRTSTAKRRSVRTEVSKDSDDLTSLETLMSQSNVSFDANSGRISTAVRLQNISSVAGFVENLRVSLKSRSFETGATQVLGAGTLCNSDSNLIDLSGTPIGVAPLIPAPPSGPANSQAASTVMPASAATTPASCRIAVPPQDPDAPYRDVPVSFIKINTGKIQSLLTQDVWIEIDSLTVGKGDASLPAASAIDALNTHAYRFFIMRPGGDNDLFYYLVDGTVSPKAALEDARKGQILFQANPVRITDINQWQSDLSDWGQPKDFVTAELHHGMWVVASPTFTQPLTTPGLPGHRFDIIFIKKGDLLTTLDVKTRKPLLVGNPMVFPEINGFIATDALCTLSTDPQRRVLVGDKIKIAISVQERRSDRVEIDKLAGSDQKWHRMLNIFAGQNPQIFRLQLKPVTQVDAKDLKKYGVGFSLSNKILPIPLSEWAKKSGVLVERNNGELTLSFEVTAEMMPDGKGEACLDTLPEVENLKVGRKYTPFGPPDGKIATTPGGPSITPTHAMDMWANEEPYSERPFLIARKTTGYLEITQVGRPKDSKDIAFRDSDDNFYLTPVCAAYAKDYAAYKPNYTMLQSCATAADFFSCLRTAANPPPTPIGVPPPLPAPTQVQVTPSQKAQIVQQDFQRNCTNRKAKATFIRSCTGKDTPKDDAECLSTATAAP